jgi:hypothetical protein
VDEGRILNSLWCVVTVFTLKRAERIKGGRFKGRRAECGLVFHSLLF